MKYRRVLAVALAAPLACALLSTLGIGSAFAQQTYPPETLSTGLVHCGSDNSVTVTVDGVMPNSNIHIVIDFAGSASDVNANVAADGLGFSNTVYPIPNDASGIITVTITGFDFPNSTPFEKDFNVDRRTCPDLPETGANSFPIGKLALGITLAGAFLAVVALRRRPRPAAA